MRGVAESGLIKASTAERLLEAELAWRLSVRRLEAMAARRLLAAGLAHRSCEQRFDALAAGWSQGWAQAVAFSLRRHVARPANAGPEPCVDGLSPRLGPGAAYASMARPVTRARSLSCFSDIGSSRNRARSRPHRLVPSPGPGAITPTKASPALAGPWPPRPPWFVPPPGPGAASAALARPITRARSRPHRLVPSPGPGALSATMASPSLAGPWQRRPPWLVPCDMGPEPPRQHWLVPFPGPGAVR